jgi:hypothetical protein
MPNLASRPRNGCSVQAQQLPGKVQDLGQRGGDHRKALGAATQQGGDLVPGPALPQGHQFRGQHSQHQRLWADPSTRMTLEGGVELTGQVEGAAGRLSG